jgi:hypothetical protein
VDQGGISRSLSPIRPAGPLLETALADRERVLGPDHPDALASQNRCVRVPYKRTETSAGRPSHEIIPDGVSRPHHSALVMFGDLAVVIVDWRA